MSKSKYTDILCILITVLAVVITVLFMNGKALGMNSVTSDDMADTEGIFSERDYVETWDPATATEISFNKLEQFRSGGAYELNGDLYIVKKGTYVLSGEMKDQQVIVSADNAKVQIVLAGVTIEETDKAAIYVQEADKVFLTLDSESENVIKVGSLSSEASENEDDSEKETLPDAAIYSCDDLTINGSGSLSVSIEEGHGIKSKDDLVIVNGNLSIDAGGTALLGKDSVRIGGGSLDLNAGNDGIKANNQTNAEKGYVKIVDGELVINAEHDGIQAQTSLEIEGGDITITTGGGYTNAEQKQEAFGHGGMGKGGFGGFHGQMGDTGERPEGMTMPEGQERHARPEGGMTMSEGQERQMPSEGGMTPPEGQERQMPPEGGMTMPEGQERQMPSENAADDAGSSKGLKAGTMLYVSGGNIVIDAKEDALHSDGDLVLENGSITIKAGDDAVHAETVLTVTGGKLYVETCYEGLEANDIEVHNGEIDITSSDDAMNASGTIAENNLPLLHITGGNIHVDARGDGLDSNGNLIIEGGMIIVDGPSDGGNGALDSGTESGGDLVIHGGTILALGSSGMAETFSENSTQYSFLCTLDSIYEQGDTITISDSTGEIVYSYTAQKTGNSVVFSSSDLKMGETYTITAGIIEQEMQIEGITNGKSTGMNRGMNGGFPGGSVQRQG